MPDDPIPAAACEQNRLELIVDACALLNLEAMSILSLAVERFTLVISQTVVWELENTARYRDYSGDLAQRVLGRIHRMEIIALGTPVVRDQRERDCLQLAQERNGIVVSDDLAAIRMSEQGGVENYFSVFVLFALALEGAITPEQARRALEEVRLQRHWRNNILYQTGVRLLDSLD